MLSYAYHSEGERGWKCLSAEERERCDSHRNVASAGPAPPLASHSAVQGNEESQHNLNPQPVKYAEQNDRLRATYCAPSGGMSTVFQGWWNQQNPHFHFVKL